MELTENKVCNICGTEKPISDFPKRYNYCKDCMNKRHREWRAKNSERLKEYYHNYHSEHSDKFKERYQQNKEKVLARQKMS